MQGHRRDAAGWVVIWNPNGPTERPDFADLRADLNTLRGYLADADAYDPDTLREMRAREARLVALIGDSHE